MDRLDEKITGMEFLISYLDDICFYVDLNLSLIPKEIINHRDKLVEYLHARLKEMKRD